MKGLLGKLKVVGIVLAVLVVIGLVAGGGKKDGSSSSSEAASSQSVVQEQKTNSDDSAVGNKEETKPENGIAVPGSAKDYKNTNYTDVKYVLEQAGFTNIIIEADPDLITGFVHDDGDIEDISINGISNFNKGDVFSPDARIRIQYHTYREKTEKKDNKQSSQEKTQSNQTSQKEVEAVEPQADYRNASAGELIDALDNNALNAKQTYEKANIRLSGTLSNIDASGKYFNLSDGDSFSFTSIQCFIKNDETRDRIASAAKGDTLTVCGKVTMVGEILGYSIDVDYIE